MSISARSLPVTSSSCQVYLPPHGHCYKWFATVLSHRASHTALPSIYKKSDDKSMARENYISDSFRLFIIMTADAYFRARRRWFAHTSLGGLLSFCDFTFFSQFSFIRVVMPWCLVTVLGISLCLICVDSLSVRLPESRREAGVMKKRLNVIWCAIIYIILQLGNLVAVDFKAGMLAGYRVLYEALGLSAR